MTSRPAGLVLMVPSYGGGGSGEFARSLVLASALARRHPALRIEFVLPGGPGTRHDAPFPCHIHAGPPAAKAAFDEACITRLGPDVVVFDSGCRSSTLRRCRALGIRSVYVSDRAGTRRKPFRLDWLHRLDAHWHQREWLTAPAFTASQRLLSRFSRTRRLVFDTCFDADDREAPPAPAVAASVAQPFALFVPGGGGYRVEGRWVGDLYFEAAERLHAATGLAGLTLPGPLYRGELRTGTPAGARTAVLAEAGLAELIPLLRRAAIVICNGGSGTLHQALACGAACVAAPLGGDDQPARIAAYAAAGLLHAAPPTAAALAERAAGLLAPEVRGAVQSRVAALGVVNGLPRMLDALEALLPESPQ